MSKPNPPISINSTTFLLLCFLLSLALLAFNILATFHSSLLPDGIGIGTTSAQRLRELENEVRTLKRLIRGTTADDAQRHRLVRDADLDSPAVPLPSARTTPEEESSIRRKFYGGRGDKPHLGGFTSFDPNGVSPSLWEEMVSYVGIRSVVDVGCGRGISTAWFVLHGMEYVVCVEGSHDAVTNSLLPGLEVGGGTEFELVEHDFSLGPWWPSRTVDAAWCVEFTEHIGRNYQHNYFASFRKAAYIFMTHSQRGGWHHVEVHDSDWWILRMESMGFVYSEYLTKKMRGTAMKDRKRTDFLKAMENHEKKSTFGVAQHLTKTLQVFINPSVASLPQHAHLLAEHGCYAKGQGGIECGKKGNKAADLTPLPDSYKPVVLTEEMDKAWKDLIYDLPLPGQWVSAEEEDEVVVAD